MDEAQETLTLEEAQKLLGLSRPSLYYYKKLGWLHIVWGPYGRRVVLTDEVNRLAEALKRQDTSPVA